MAYLSIINNATGLKFWPLVPCSRLLWDTAKQISEEINLLKEYLFTYKTSETFTIDDGKICVRILDFPDKMLAVTANRRGMLRNAIFDLSMFGAYENKKCKILFENRELILKNNKIADTFKPYERHIYLISK
ncbi:MAG: hypothetical protein A2096_08460 [Spirochaetes bacterium GWF1_41_5]|nr:MAG: hypothetical protein A2096_08460 [Spirochaetes bacterium GWF1_41_5]HBE02579.1 hypothetical protein [Spirochaetia bacterium]